MLWGHLSICRRLRLGHHSISGSAERELLKRNLNTVLILIRPNIIELKLRLVRLPGRAVWIMLREHCCYKRMELRLHFCYLSVHFKTTLGERGPECCLLLVCWIRERFGSRFIQQAVLQRERLLQRVLQTRNSSAINVRKSKVPARPALAGGPDSRAGWLPLRAAAVLLLFLAERLLTDNTKTDAKRSGSEWTP